MSVKDIKATWGGELDRLKKERVRVLQAFKRHMITAAEAIEKRNEIDDRILKLWRKLRKISK